MEYKFLPSLSNVMARLRGTRHDTAVSHAISGTSAAVSGMYGSVFSGFGGGWDVERAVEEALERVIWVFRCVDAIATNQSRLPMVVREDDPVEGKVVEDKAVFYALNRRANIYETAQQFRYRLSAQLLLSKRGAYIEVVKGASGRPALHLLPAHLVEPIPDPQRFVAGYRLMDSVNGEVFIEPERVIWVRLKPHPLDPYLQLTPLTAAGLAVETDWLARLFNRNFLMNDGRPGLLISILGQLNTADAKEIKARFTGSPHQAGRTTVIESEGIDVRDLSATPRDLQWLEAIRGSKEDILLAFGTPESVLGNASGRTFDNADAEKENWWEETMRGHCDPIARSLDPLTGSIEDDRFVSMDYDGVDVLQRRRRARHDKAREEFTAGTRTLDELFQIRGEEPWNVAATRSIIMPNGLVISRNQEDTEAVAALPVVGVQQAADVQKEAQLGAQQGAALGQRNFQNIIAARAMQLAGGTPGGGNGDGSNYNYSYANQRPAQRRSDYDLAKELPQAESKDYVDAEDVGLEIVDKVNPFEDIRTYAEGQLEGVLATWSSMQEQIVMERLDHAKCRKYTRHWEDQRPGMTNTKALNGRYAVDTQRWASTLEKDMARALEKVARQTLKKAAADMNASGITKVMFARGLGNELGRSDMTRVFGTRAKVDDLVRDLLEPISDVVKDAAKNQSNRLVDRIQEMDAEGASMTAIKKEVAKLIGSRSSWKTDLARAMTTSMVEAAKHAAYSKAGDIMVKFWNTMEDEKVRRTHASVDGEELPVTKAYRVGKYKMQYPGHMAGGIEERIGCRCYADYAISDDAADEYDEIAY